MKVTVASYRTSRGCGRSQHEARSFLSPIHNTRGMIATSTSRKSRSRLYSSSGNGLRSQVMARSAIFPCGGDSASLRCSHCVQQWRIGKRLTLRCEDDKREEGCVEL